ncbi:MAG: small multi-drug export protein [Candidatus Bathyarchaeota archaeon]|nr:small multi-drug export protein [Candidatus Bathyarchaeota archaeon]
MGIELFIFILLSVTLECGMGILYGVAVGYDPWLVFPMAIAINFLSIFVAVFVVDRLLAWKQGFKTWLERRLARGQRIIDKYGCLGIVMGIVVLSPMQLAIVGRLLGIRPQKLYPALFLAIMVVATVFLAAALGIFKVLLA